MGSTPTRSSFTDKYNTGDKEIKNTLGAIVTHDFDSIIADFADYVAQNTAGKQCMIQVVRGRVTVENPVGDNAEFVTPWLFVNHSYSDPQTDMVKWLRRGDEIVADSYYAVIITPEPIARGVTLSDGGVSRKFSIVGEVANVYGSDIAVATRRGAFSFSDSDSFTLLYKTG